MAAFVVRAQAIGEQLTDELRVLLSRAFTDERHLAAYTAAELERLRAAIDAVHSGTGAMPREWMRRFPTVRNLWRRPESRLDSLHFMERRAQHLAGHVALFEQEMVFDGEDRVTGGYVEDVATDPGYLHMGVATSLMRLAMEHGARAEYDVLALGTAIPEFYERLGWQRWAGSASHERLDGSEGVDTQEMVLALNATGRDRIERHRAGHIFRPAREHLD